MRLHNAFSSLLKKSSSLADDYDNEDNIYRQTFILDAGHFRYFHDNHVEIKFSNGFILHMTPEQVHSCQVCIDEEKCSILLRLLFR